MTRLYWLGAVLLCTAPFMIEFSIGQFLAIIALIILTVQAIETKMFNLVLCNTVGIMGYLFSMFT